MPVDETATAPAEPSGVLAGNFGLTKLAADLSYKGNADIHSQGNYDYHAHAHVLPGCASPLGSQGYASVVRHPSSS